MIKEGIWKIRLRNDRAQKSHVRRFQKQLERLNSLDCFKPVVLFLFCFNRVGRWNTEPKNTHSHESFISSYASATPKGECVPKRTFHQRTRARLLGDPLGVYSFCYNFSETFFPKFSILACWQGSKKQLVPTFHSWVQFICRCLNLSNHKLYKVVFCQFMRFHAIHFVNSCALARVK